MNRCIIIAFLLLLTELASAQQSQFSNLFANQKLNSKQKWNVAKAKNEADYVFLRTFLFYKKCISSQDHNKCNFHPSCSQYAILSIQKKGVLIGLLSAFDRLTRCNGLNGKDYPVHPTTHLMYDPVD